MNRFVHFCILCAALLAGLTAPAQQTSEWSPSISEDNKNATLEDTVKFVATITSDPTVTQMTLPETKKFWSSMIVTFGAQSPGKCQLNWGQLQLDKMSIDRFRSSIDLAKVDPLSISVTSFITRDEPHGFVVRMRGSNNGTFGHQIHERQILQNAWSITKWKSLDEEEKATCEAGDKKCIRREQEITEEFIFFSDQDTSHRVARALMHAALLCGGTKSVSPF